ncbi:MAG: alpha/beta hydrolase, partial [Candidatus Aphodousia sp.]|nr:alpha/beta hydrolase [Candidatus Aphodousia sp.]
AVASDKRLTVLTDFLPQYRIRSFSHLGIMFSPDNPWYGSQGKQRYCLRGQSEAMRNYCHTGKSVWYGSWREDRDGHPYARLTFNPYFEQQNALIDATLKSIP